MIRRATDADIPAVVAIYATCWRLAYGGIVPEADIATETAPDLERWHRIVAEERPGLFVAELDGRVVGWVRLIGVDLRSLHVDPDAQRLGVGAALLAHAHREIGPEIFLLCVVGNERARRFYEGQGWHAPSRAMIPIRGRDYPADRFVPPPARPAS